MKTRIREIRESINMKRTELAERAKVPYQALAKWESGINEINLLQAASIARVLGVSISDLVVHLDDEDARFEEITRLYNSMDEGGKSALLASAQGLAAAFPQKSVSSDLTA